MEAKIILALSLLKKPPKDKPQQVPKPLRFTCPDGSTQMGLQTNEAPVKYLLKKDPTIRRILCLVTESAKKSGALTRFSEEIKGYSRLVQIETIPIDDTGRMSDSTMAELTRQLSKGDSVYLDSSGGSRYTAMGLLQLARILEFKGVKLRQVVYANISAGQSHTIDDVTDLYQSLDLIGGMHELADFGSVDNLRRYFRRDPSPDAAAILRLLDAIEQMTDAITLCRMGVLKKAMAAYQTAIDEAQGIRDPIMRELLWILREKFGDSLTTPWLIGWCLDHKMLTQALSLYREWMPEYILCQSGLVTAVPELPGWWPTNKYQDRHVFLWSRLINLALPEDNQSMEMYYTIETIRNLDRLLPGSGYAVTDVDRVRRVAWDFLYIQSMRNMVLHGNDEAPIDRRLRRALEQAGYDADFESMTVSDMLRHIRQALNRVKA